MNKLAICAIAKNEQFGLEEWINYNRVIGVEHFYIYDNGSDVPVSHTLSKYIAAGLATCIDFPGASRQMPAYEHCLRNYGINNQWIAFIDCDEFLVPKQTDYVPDVLDKFTAYGALQVNWVIFGSNGHIQRPSGLVMENYIKGSGAEWDINLHTKAIVQPKLTRGPGGNPHHFIYHPYHYAVDEREIHVANAWSTAHSVKLLQLNHYTTKSLEDFSEKISKGRADAAHLPTRKIEDLAEIDRHCTTEDTTILRFVERTRALYL